MKIAVLGAGALGGYFGGRLLQAGRDVQFLVRPARAALLRQNGLVIHSPCGDVKLDNPPTLTAEQLKDAPAPADLVLLSCKAYDLDSAMDAIAPVVGPRTIILPMLNGMRHIELLSERFGKDKVIGGLCLISAALDPQGEIHQFNEMHDLVFGALDASQTDAVHDIKLALDGAGFRAVESSDVLQRMWEKWVFIASLASLTTLFRAPVGEIVAAGGTSISEAVYDQCAAIAAHHGHAPRAAAVEQGKRFLTTPGSTITASMCKDMLNGTRTEAEHIIGALLARRPADGDALGRSSLLEAALVNLRVAEARRLMKESGGQA
ncbi:ketopantoate reductase family protein [Noviherbaspirillum galbum]|uniref:2-dehydropantoate 2-reductase n=1 Tax=Noviherbaspirillum galbum TaxID=2709383 RepID=A0A6B3SPM3_9BURK|nr:ketopantoate reductase family protein [Noviherbaspirillum galbum]NEX62591.1 ketopantoate reductase family protein [Noviherbaspirillum galbum]